MEFLIPIADQILRGKALAVDDDSS